MTDLQIAVVHPGGELGHVEDAAKVAVADLTSHPRLSPRLVAPTIKHDDGRAFVLHLDIEDKVGVLFVNGATALLPLGFDDEVVRPTLRMVDNEVAILRSPVDARPNMKVPCVDRLAQYAGRGEAAAGNEGVATIFKMRQDERDVMR